MNILCAVNDNWISQFKVLMLSLKETQKSPVSVFFLNPYLRYNSLMELEEYVMSLGFSFKNIDFPDDKKIYLNKILISQAKKLKKENLSIETYYRIFAINLLPKTLDRILWLDADVIVRKDLTEFYNLDTLDKFIAAADTDVDNRINSTPKYFNAGIILFDLKKCRLLNLFTDLENIQKICLKTYKFNDQDILNLIFKDKVLFVDPFKYNMAPHTLTYYPNKEDIPGIIEKASIIHYASNLKPWTVTSDMMDYKYFYGSSHLWTNLFDKVKDR